MATADRIRIAAAQTVITTDPVGNGAVGRIAEGALSGYAGAAKPHFAGWNIDWAPVAAELRRTTALAAELGIWAVLGGNHRLGGGHRPHNSAGHGLPVAGRP